MWPDVAPRRLGRAGQAKAGPARQGRPGRGRQGQPGVAPCLERRNEVLEAYLQRFHLEVLEAYLQRFHLGRRNARELDGKRFRSSCRCLVSRNVFAHINDNMLPSNGSDRLDGFLIIVLKKQNVNICS